MSEWVSTWGHGNKTIFEPLSIDFAIPEDLEDNIRNYIDDLNHGGRLADCYEQEIRTTLNGCDLCLTDEQVSLLRNYYCRGGIYDDGTD